MGCIGTILLRGGGVEYKITKRSEHFGGFIQYSWVFRLGGSDGNGVAGTLRPLLAGRLLDDALLLS